MRVIVYKLGSIYKAVRLREVPPIGYEGEKDDERSEENDEPVNERKLDNNIIRAKSAIFELAACNEWDDFVTLTIDGSKQDRYDVHGYIKRLGQWIGNYRKKYELDTFKYLLIPERHKDGAVHMHGLFYRGGKSRDECGFVVNEHGYWDLPYYRKRFGYISVGDIQSHERVSRYITKYVTKSNDFADELGMHLYYASKGLKRKEKCFAVCGDSIPDISGWEWFEVNDFAAVKWLTLQEFEYITSVKEY